MPELLVFIDHEAWFTAAWLAYGVMGGTLSSAGYGRHTPGGFCWIMPFIWAMISYSSAAESCPSVELICSPLPPETGLAAVMAALEDAAPLAAGLPIVCAGLVRT